MTGTNHGLTGAIIALTIKQPAAAILLSFVSHFAQDIIPHWNYGVSRLEDKSGKFFTRRYNFTLLSDFLLAVTLMVIFAILFPAQKWVIWACMIAAACPDLMWAYYRLYLEHIKKRKLHLDPLARLHTHIQWSQTTAGSLVEIAWFFGAFIIIISLR